MLNVDTHFYRFNVVIVKLLNQLWIKLTCLTWIKLSWISIHKLYNNNLHRITIKCHYSLDKCGWKTQAIRALPMWFMRSAGLVNKQTGMVALKSRISALAVCELSVSCSFIIIIKLKVKALTMHDLRIYGQLCECSHASDRTCHHWCTGIKHGYVLAILKHISKL